MKRRQILYGMIVLAFAALAIHDLYPETQDLQRMNSQAFDLEAYRGAMLEAIYPQPDGYLGEELQPGEVLAAADLIEELARKVQIDYAAGAARRDAHPKAHGCVTATLALDAHLPAELTGGIIQAGSSYNAVVRFSNGSPDPNASDTNGDTRGMAIKLFGVPGDKLLSDPGNPDAQDFILISSPFFFINSARNYSRFFQAVDSGSILRLAAVPTYLGWKGSMNAFHMLRQKIANPLETRYWSVVPSQLGEGEGRQAVKFSARPLGSTSSTIPTNADPNFLRAALVASLSKANYQMEFMIQRRGNTGLSVEDSIPEWPESEAPFQRIGVLTIHQQTFNTAARNTYCENLSFNPWHSLPAHRPLGMISRTRRVVYQAIAELRHRMNDATFSTGLPTDGR